MDLLRVEIVLIECAFITLRLRLGYDRRGERTQKEGRTNETSIALMISVVITCNRYNLARRANVYEESA